MRARHIYSIHDKSGLKLIKRAGVTGTLVETVHIWNSHPIAWDPWESVDLIVRLNNGYGSHEGTIPPDEPGRYEKFAEQCAKYARLCRNVKHFIVANEPNHEQEWPHEQMIHPFSYGRAYSLTRDAIRAVNPDFKVYTAAVAPWTAKATYPQNQTGDWITYFVHMLNWIQEVDGICIHSYTHGSDPELITSDAKMAAPFENRHYNFFAYKDFMNAIPEKFWGKPVFLTETNQNGPWLDVNNGWVQRMYAEINNWNMGVRNNYIDTATLYRMDRLDQWYIEDKEQVQWDFEQACSYEYQTQEAMMPVKPCKLTKMMGELTQHINVLKNQYLKDYVIVDRNLLAILEKLVLDIAEEINNG